MSCSCADARLTDACVLLCLGPALPCSVVMPVCGGSAACCCWVGCALIFQRWVECCPAGGCPNAAAATACRGTELRRPVPGCAPAADAAACCCAGAACDVVASPGRPAPAPADAWEDDRVAGGSNSAAGPASEAASGTVWAGTAGGPAPLGADAGSWARLSWRAASSSS